VDILNNATRPEFQLLVVLERPLPSRSVIRLPSALDGHSSVEHGYGHVNVASLPNPDGLGQTDPTATATCHCTCGSPSKLIGCDGRVDLRVRIKSGLSPRLDAFARRGESDHVIDFALAAGRFQKEGDSAEADLMDEPFSSQKECERRSKTYLEDRLGAVRNAVFNESQARWDGGLGPHAYIPWYNPLWIIQRSR
jgi:hypothetical protein